MSMKLKLSVSALLLGMLIGSLITISIVVGPNIFGRTLTEHTQSLQISTRTSYIATKPSTKLSISKYITTTLSLIRDLNYMGWKGSESLIKPLSKYLAIAINASQTYVHLDLYWPLAQIVHEYENPFKAILQHNNIVVVLGEIIGIESIRLRERDMTVDIIYKVKIIDVLVEFNKSKILEETTRTPPKECIVFANGSRYCIDYSTIMGRVEKILSCAEQLKKGGVIELQYPAWLSRNTMMRILMNRSSVENITVQDIATPFPLPNIGNTYILFIRVTHKGFRILYDYVWGPYAYIVLNNSVYSLNYIDYPVELKPEEFFDGYNIYWRPYSYEKLREIALEVFSVYGLTIQQFIDMLRG